MYPQAMSKRIGIHGCLMLFVFGWVGLIVFPAMPQNPGGRRVQEFRTSKRTANVVSSLSSTVIAVTDIRNLDHEKWLERMEVEIKNISPKPVYFVLILIVFLDTQSPHLGIPLAYGRWELISPKRAFATPDDKPINPGDSYVFKIPEIYRDGLESRMAEGRLPELKKLFVMVEDLSLGDGTGINYSGSKWFSYR